MLGLLPAAWSLLGYDSTAHMIEETKDADASAGWAMPYAVGISAISGLPYIVALTLCVQVASSPTFPTVPHSCPPCPIPPPPPSPAALVYCLHLYACYAHFRGGVVQD